VRLWFNNNKKVFFHPSGSNIASSAVDSGPEGHHQRMEQPKCYVPSRSLSVVQLQHVPSYPRQVEEVRRPPTPSAIGPMYTGVSIQPKNGSFAECLLEEYKVLGHGCDIGRQLKEAKAVSQKISSLHEDVWKQMIGAHVTRTTINADEDECGSRGIFQPQEIPETVSYGLIETSLVLGLGDPVVVSYDAEVQAQRIHYGNMTADVGIMSPVASMTVDDSSGLIWVNSGNLVKSFDSRNLNRRQTIIAGNKRSPKSAMTFWRDSLVVASGATVLSWSQRLLENAGEADDGFDVCLTLLMPSITCLATCADNLVVASSEHHTPRVYAQNGACVCRTIGHSAGITSLYGLDGFSFLSGSADQTAKLWDVRMPVCAASLAKHNGIVTAIWGARNGGSLVFTGGTDGVVIAWDIRHDYRFLFSVDCGQSAVQTIHYSPPAERLTVVMSEKTADDYYDMEKYIPSNIYRQCREAFPEDCTREHSVPKYSLNVVLSYSRISGSG
jgi:hypothetical protein